MALLALIAVTPGVAEAATPRFFYIGGAFGTTVRVGSPFVTGADVVSGSTGLVVLGCTDQAGLRRTSTVASVNSAPSVTTDTVLTTAESTATTTTATSRLTARTVGVNLLDGLITADVARSVSTTVNDGTTFQFSGSGSWFENLVIRDQEPQSVEPGPNTEIKLSGFGRVILNEQVPSVVGSAAVLNVNAIHVFITTPNSLSIPVGTEIIVSHAKSGLAGAVPEVLGGQSYGTSVNVGDTVTSGPSALRVMPCQGTGGEDRTNSTAAVVIPGLLKSAVVTDTVRGEVGITAASGYSDSITRGVDILDGLVTATGVNARAFALSTGSGRTLRDDGSSFLSLSVREDPAITDDVPANTTVSLPGLGKLHLRRVLRTSNSIEVRMIELVVTESGNPQGLPVGLSLRVGVAEMSIR